MDVANIEKNAFSFGKKCSDVLAEIRLFRKKQDEFYGYEGPMVKRTHTLKEDAKDLNDLADFYEEETETSVQGMLKLIEPLMLVFMGGMVGGLLIAMYLPVFQMAGNSGN
jgi:hypothetical protein